MDRYLIKPSASKLSGSNKNNDTTNEKSDLPEEHVSNNEMDMEIDSSDSEDNLGEIKKTKQYKQKFRDNWRETFKWAKQHGKFSTLCTVCNVKINLKRHNDSNSQQKTMKAMRITPSVKKAFETRSEKSSEEKVKAAELKLVMFLAEHNLPFTLMEHLPSMYASAFPDSKIAEKVKMKRKKATQISTTVLGPANKANVVLDLRQNFFSIIIDETTDVSTSKCLAVIARYYKNNQILDRFLDLIEMESASASGIFEAIQQCLNKNNIPVSNIIGLGADNCSVMMGNLNGVKALFEEINQSIAVIGCSCHSFHLCSSYAAEKLPRSVEQFARDIYNYFSNSSKRLIELKECQIFAKEKPRRMLRPSQTRWLSLQAVINRILDHWSSLELFFTNAVVEDKLQSAITILNTLKNPIYKVYFYFLSYILDVINKLNLEFQAESPKIQVLLSRVTSLYKIILKSFLRKSYLEQTDIQKINVSDPHKYLPLDDVYCGANVEQFKKKTQIDPTEIKNFKLRVLDYYSELARQIKKRFNFNDKILQFALKFNPKAVLSGEFNTISEAETLFPYLKVDIEKLDFEYRLISETDELSKYSDSMNEFWLNVDGLKNGIEEKMFPNVTTVAKIVMSLPHSSAAAERLFSQLNLVKSKTRNRLVVKTCESLIHMKDMLKSENKNCFDWEPNSKLLNYNKVLLDDIEVCEQDVVFQNMP